jgi:hypothetical protein
MRRARTTTAFFVLGLSVSGVACANDLDTSRQPAPRGSIGEELYGVICDRVGSQALHEDMTGASFEGICHKSLTTGAFADKVDQQRLPPPTEGARDIKDQPVSVEDQSANRLYAVNRIEALARRRADLIEAFDATFPDADLDVKNVAASDPAASCDPAAGPRTLGRELADMLGRMAPLYNDGTIPQSTESLARVMQAFQKSPEAQVALARFASRNGYRPPEVSPGMVRPLLAYPRLRDLSAESLRLMAADSNPYDPDPVKTPDGTRVVQPGAAYESLTRMLQATHEELRTATVDPPLTALAITKDLQNGRDVLSRPRGNLEVLETLFYATDASFGVAGPSRWIVKRDPRGYASVVVGSSGPGGVPTPFVDKDGDKLADVDSVGRFVTSTGLPPPSPFLSVDAVETSPAPRDPFGRAMNGAALFYEYLDTSHTFTAQMMADMRPMVDPDPTHNHETIMNAAGGAYVFFGKRTGPNTATKSYAPDPSLEQTWPLTHAEPAPADIKTRPVVLTYDGYDANQSPMLDLVYAIGQLLGDRSMDDTLAFVRKMMVDKTPELARISGDALAFKAIADKHPEAQFRNAKSVFWDEMLDSIAQIAKEPGLLEDLLRSLGNDDSLALKDIYSGYMKFGDRISYDRNDLNGDFYNFTTKKVKDSMKTPVDRSKPDTGTTRSAFQRMVQAVYDTAGVTACNKPSAVVHAKGVPIAGSADLPLSGSYKECEVFKIENLARFYLNSIVGKASLYFRPSIMRNGVAGIGAASVSTIEQSSGITGFWDPPDAKTFRPTPRWLNRLVNFDVEADSVNTGDKNYTTNHFLRDLQGLHIGTAVCPERSIADPDPDAADANPDKMIHGLRTCKDGDWLDQRDRDATLVWEDFGFYKAMSPMLNAFITHNREDLLIGMMSAMHRHWQTEKGTPGECNPKDPKDPHWCGQDGLVSYEPLLAEAFQGDILTALHDLEKTLETVTVPHCTTIDPATKRCTATADVDGLTVLAETARGLFDADRSKAIGLTDRFGKATAARNDGGTNPQVTPIYLLTGALSGMDDAFAAFAQAHPEDKERQAKWRLARSQLVDQFLRINGTTTSSSFANASIPKITPTLLDMLRAQLFANCPASFTAPYPRCKWARDDLSKKMTDVVKGPIFAGSMDVIDALRSDNGARRELQALLAYLMDNASKNDALPTMLASASDLIQLMKSDADTVPMLHVLAEAAAGPQKDAQGNVVQSSMMDSQSALLARVALRAYDKDHQEVCSREIDPNQVLNIALGNLVTPLPGKGGKPTKTPLEVIMDVIADVNRVDPVRTEKLASADYASITSQVTDFLLNKERGLEQFYEIVRQGTE